MTGSISCFVTSSCGRRSSTIISILLISSQETLLITNSRRIKLIAASLIASLYPKGFRFLHLLYRMDITLQDLLLQRLRHLTIVDFLRTSANQASSFALGLASVILIFFIFVSLNTISLFSSSVYCLVAGSCHFGKGSQHLLVPLLKSIQSVLIILFNSLFLCFIC